MLNGLLLFGGVGNLVFLSLQDTKSFYGQSLKRLFLLCHFFLKRAIPSLVVKGILTTHVGKLTLPLFLLLEDDYAWGIAIHVWNGLDKISLVRLFLLSGLGVIVGFASCLAGRPFEMARPVPDS